MKRQRTTPFTMAEHETIEKLEALYASLPTVDCKGWCWHSCGPIDMSNAERERIVNLGVEIPLFTEERSAAWAADGKGDLYCPALSFNAHEGRMGCTVYEARPLICRVWGAGEDDLSCPYGCEPSERLTASQVMSLLMESMEIGGHDDLNDLGRRTLVALIDDPEHQELTRRLMAGDRSVIPQIQTAIENKRRELSR